MVASSFKNRAGYPYYHDFFAVLTMRTRHLLNSASLRPYNTYYLNLRSLTPSVRGQA